MNDNPHAPDALAWRTFLQGLGIDLAVAATLVLSTAVTDIRWTREYWITLGLTLARTCVQTGVAYMARRFLSPQKAGR